MFPSINLRRNLIRVLLSAVILMSALAPTLPPTQLGAAAPLSAAWQAAEETSNSIPVFERPESRIGNRNGGSNSFDIQAGRSINQNNKAAERPVMFFENVGQYDPRALFVTQSAEASIFLAQSEIWFTFKRPANQNNERFQKGLEYPQEPEQLVKITNLQVLFPGANTNATVEPFNQLDVEVSRFSANHSRVRYQDIPTWGGVRYVDLYPGVDLELSGGKDGFAWQFVIRDAVKFSASKNDFLQQGIHIKLVGQKELGISNGVPQVKTEWGDHLLPELKIVGPIGDSEIAILPQVRNDELLLTGPGSSSERLEEGVLPSASPESFSLRAAKSTNLDYPSNVLFATILGGDNYSSGLDQTQGPDGAIFVTGATEASDFPVTPGSYQDTLAGLDDAFVAKFDGIDGHLIWATYLGGTNDDVGRCIALNANGEIYVGGGTESADFPVAGTQVGPSSAGGFLAKLNPDGNELLYSSHVGNSDDAAIRQMFIRMEAGSEVAYMMDRSYPTVTAYKLILGNSAYEYSYALGSGVFWNAMALDMAGNAYFTGYQDVSGSTRDVVVTAIDENGTPRFESPVTFGGRFSDKAYGITLDQAGNIYVTGFTDSPDFPSQGIPLSSNFPSQQSVLFLTILGPDGAIRYSSTYDAGLVFYDGWSMEKYMGQAVHVDAQGKVYIIGEALFYDPRTGQHEQNYLLVLKLSPYGTGTVNYSVSSINLVDINDWGWPNSSNATIDSDGNAYVTGSIFSLDGQGVPAEELEVFLFKISTQASVIPDISVLGSGKEDCCLSGNFNHTQEYIGDPINTRTGAYDYSVSDISLSTSAGELSFIRNYGSFARAFETTLAPGWTHNHDTRLVLPSDPEGQPSTIQVKLHTINRYLFSINGDGSYTPTPGVFATLERQPGPPVQYLLTSSAQETYTFDENGKLLYYTTPQGQQWVYVYDPVSGNLDRIHADGGLQYLDLEYDSTGSRLTAVSDQTGRSIAYHYDATTGDLASVDDLLDQTWTYAYEEASHLLTRVAAPDGTQVERTEYYPDARVWKQFDGEDNLVVELIYHANGTTSVKDGLGKTQTHTYDERGVLVNSANAAETDLTKVYNHNFRVTLTSDALGNRNQLFWSDDSVNLRKVVDAAGNETDIAYDGFNNPTSVTDPLFYETKYFYTDTHFTTLPTHVEYPLYFEGSGRYASTDYEYYPPTSGASAGKLKLATDPLGRQTYYTYTSSGQTASVTTAYGTPDAQTTTYTYDALGRLVKLVDPKGMITRQQYDAAGRLTRTIQNVDPSTPDAENPPQNAISGDNLYNLYTRYYYDARSNPIAVVDTNWNVARTYYDLSARPIAEVQNLVVANTPADTEAEVIVAIQTPLVNVPGYDPGHPDWNIQMSTVYDDAGNLLETHDPQGIITRNAYDQANRLILTIQNFVGTGAYDSNFPDRNIRTEYFYDPNNNLIATKDVLGTITRTYYDELNRPKTVVENLRGQEIAVETPPERGNSTNIRTDTYYDANGNVIATEDPKGAITRTYYDALNRPVAIVQNLVDKPYTDDDLPDPEQGECGTERNVCSFTYYDPAGNVVATVDPLGAVTRTYYDEANRPIATIQNWTGTDLYGDLSTAPAYDPDFPDRNVRASTSAYNADGSLDTATDALGRVTKYVYNQGGQVVETIVNYTNNGTPQNDQDQRNLITRYTYDALGRQIETMDTLGRVTRNTYDALGRMTSVTENYLAGQPQNYLDAAGNRYNLITHYAYDGRGNQIAVTDTLGMVSRTYFDALARPVSEVRNLVGQAISIPTPPARTSVPDPSENLRTDTVYLGNGNVDYVIDEMGAITDYDYDTLGRLTTSRDPLGKATHFEYDANGNRTGMTDARAVTTRYEYDALNRLTAVIENYQAGVTPGFETNIRTTYTYDANGNRLSIRNANSHLAGDDYRMASTYDGLGRLKTETDALSNTLTYRYDALGNLTALLDANGRTTRYVYDELSRLATIDYPQPDADVSFDYDAAGRRQMMIDGTGTTSWSYNNLDQPQAITDPFAASVSYGYDAAGNRTRLAYPDQRVVEYEYDAVNRLSTVTSGQQAIASYQYDAAGRVQRVERLNGINTHYSYLKNGWLREIRHASEIATLGSYQYQYDDVGNRILLTETLLTEYTPPAETYHVYLPLLIRSTATASSTRENRSAAAAMNTSIHYTYDSLSRLTAADYSTGEQYAYHYDAVGNRLLQVTHGITTTYQYDHANRLSRVNGVTYAWDANGNLLQDGANTYTYDSANRLKTLANPSVTASYAYNGLGDRLREVINGQTTRFTMDLNTGLTQALSDGVNSYIYGNERIAQANADTEYFLGDALGSVRQLASSRGAITYANSYDPYGVANQSYGASETAYGYTGEYTSNGLVYLRARHYAPGMARFLTRDPWGGGFSLPMSYNKWLYVYANPLNHIDPTGRKPATNGDWWRYPSYGIYFLGEWSIIRLVAVEYAIRDVGDAFRRTVSQPHRDTLDAFATVYQTRSMPLIFLYGNNFDSKDCSLMKTLNNLVKLTPSMEIGSGGITFEKVSYYTDDGQKLFARMIKFASMTGERYKSILKMKNNVVHELGHLFQIAIKNRGAIAPFNKLSTPYDQLSVDMATDERLQRSTDRNQTSGFASPGYDLTWQQHSCIVDDLGNPLPACILSGEIFADQFLGWTYDTWETEINPATGKYEFTDAGRARADWMDKNMYKWLKPALSTSGGDISWRK